MNHIKGLLAVVIVGGLLYGGWLRYEAFLTQGQKPPEGTLKLNEMDKDGVPEFSMELLGGKKVSLSDFNDKVVIVNFWASWCEPCVKEFPSLIKLLQKYKDDVVLLAVSADYTLEDLEGFAKAFKVSDVPNFLVSWDKDQKIATMYGTQVLPESYIVGKDRFLIRKVAGVEEWDSPVALEFFRLAIEANKNGKLREFKTPK